MEDKLSEQEIKFIERIQNYKFINYFLEFLSIGILSLALSIFTKNVFDFTGIRNTNVYEPTFFLMVIIGSLYFKTVGSSKSIINKLTKPTQIIPSLYLEFINLAKVILILVIVITADNFLKPSLAKYKKDHFKNDNNHNKIPDDQELAIQKYLRIEQAKFENNPWVFALCKSNCDLECENDIVNFLGRYSITPKNVNETNNQCIL